MPKYLQKPFIADLRFTQYFPSAYQFYGSPYPPFSAKDKCCLGPWPLFSLLLKNQKKQAKLYSIDYEFFQQKGFQTAINDIKKKFTDFGVNTQLKDLYIVFTFKTTATLSHSTMIHIKKSNANGKNIEVLFKNSFGSTLKGDFTKNFPKMVNLLNEVFDKVKIVSDKTQQQSLSSYSCSIINYFNMVDHALGRAYRIPKVDSKGDNSPEVARFRGLVAKDYARFLKVYHDAKESAQRQGTLKFPALDALKKRMNDAFWHNHQYQLPTAKQLETLRPLFDFQVKHFLKKMDKFSLDSISSEKNYVAPKNNKNKIRDHILSYSNSSKIPLISALSIATLSALYFPVFYSVAAVSAIVLIFILHHSLSNQNQKLRSGNITNNITDRENSRTPQNKSIVFLNSFNHFSRYRRKAKSQKESYDNSIGEHHQVKEKKLTSKVRYF